MAKVYQVHYSPVFKITLDRLIHFLDTKFSPTVAQQAKTAIQQAINNQLRVNPQLAPISDRLVTIGLTQYRQFLVDEHNLIFYKIDEGVIELLAVMDARQSISKLLYEVSLSL